MSKPPSESGARKRELFLKALEKESPEERAAFLDATCGKDAELRAGVDALLRGHRDDSFLEQAAVAVDPADASRISITEKPGDRIGRYKLREKIGEGGCGVVYVAEQEQPVRRRVALKVIKLGMDTKSVIARFEAERQALAMMDHPNIAKVFDAGTTETGRPYFVMELVRGIRITDYCDQAKLPMAHRLALFTQVCSAVQHAHQKGIIHRDLKPSNILVTLHDGVPMPKVIDFGIAKATEGRLTDKTVYTELHQFIGTPAYMSPEQAEMSALDIDTRSDIYSLGVLLYELLTGRTPFDAKDLLQAGFDEMRRRIREEEPQRPSTRLSTLVSADLTTVANQRQAEAPRLINLLRGDLDWIVMKALEKDRTRRYETANGLAADIQRHLGNEPVEARPPSRLYQFQKMVRRNKVAVAAGAIVTAALVIGLGISLWQSVEKTRAYRRAVAAEREQLRLRQQAEAEGRRATEEADIAKAVTDFLRNDVLRAAGSDYQRKTFGVWPNANLTVAEALDRAARDIGDRFGDQPLVEAAIRYSIGSTYKELHDYPAAIPHLAKALQLYRRRYGLPSSKTWNTMHKLAGAYLRTGRHRESIELYEEMLRFAKGHFGERKEETSFARYNLGHAYVEGGRLKEGIALIEQEIEWNKANGAKREDDALWLSILAGAYSNLRQPARAVELAEEVLRITEATRGPDGPEMIVSRQNLAIYYFEAGRRADAFPLLEEALHQSRKHLGAEHPDTLATSRLLAEHYQKNGRVAEAESLFRQSAEIVRKLPEQQPGRKIRSLRSLAAFLVTSGQPVEAETVYREALQLARTRAELVNDSSTLEGVLSDFAEFLYRQRRIAEAEPLYRELVERRRSRLPAHDENVVTPTASLGRVLADWAWVEHANSLEGDVGKLTSKSQVRIAHAESNQSLLTSAVTQTMERAREAERLLRECLAIWTANTNTTRGRLGDAHSRLGAAVLSVAVTEPGLTANARMAKIRDAETLLVAGHELMQQSKSADARHRRDSLERLVRLYTAAGKIEQAAEWQRKLEAFDQSAAEKKRQSTTEAPP